MNQSSKPVDKAQVEEWTIVAARAADEKKATDTVILDVSELLTVTDAFVITSAANTRQVKTIADEVEKQVKAMGGPSPLRLEGLSEAKWVLIDYGDFVVHVFLQETREFYDLERLWQDAPKVDWHSSDATVS